jgi:hypothetical protein
MGPAGKFSGQWEGELVTSTLHLPLCCLLAMRWVVLLHHTLPPWNAAVDPKQQCQWILDCNPNRRTETNFAQSTDVSLRPKNVQRGTTSRIKICHLCFHFVSASFALSHHLHSPWTTGSTGDKHLVTRGKTTPSSGNDGFLIVARLHLTNPKTMINWTTLWPILLSNCAYLSSPTPVLPLRKPRAHVCTPQTGWNAYSPFPKLGQRVMNFPSLHFTITLVSEIGMIRWVSGQDVLKPLELGLWPRTLVTKPLKLWVKQQQQPFFSLEVD